MKTQDTRQEILDMALEKLQEAVNLNVQIHYDQHHFPKLRIKYHEMVWDFVVLIKEKVAPSTLGNFFHEQPLFIKEQERILVTWHVTAKLADQMKKMEIPFIDVAGNAYINMPPLFIFIKGNRPMVRDKREQPVRAFQPTGLHVIFALLCNPGLEDYPFRKIAEMADVALGTVGWVINDLKNLGFLIDRGKRGRKLINKKELFNRWVDDYHARLRPKNIVGHYRAHNVDWKMDEEILQFNAYWGGEVAAGMLTKYLKPNDVTIYVKEQHNRLLLKNKLLKDPDGNIEILNAFWNFEFNIKLPHIVHPILIYADLMATGDTRNIETAGIIYEQEIIRFIQEG